MQQPSLKNIGLYSVASNKADKSTRKPLTQFATQNKNTKKPSYLEIVQKRAKKQKKYHATGITEKF